MSGTALQPLPSTPRATRREPWDKRPAVYHRSHAKAGQPFPRNTHRPRYAFIAQDLTPHPRTRLCDRAVWDRAAVFQIPCPRCGAAAYFQCERNGSWTEMSSCPERRDASRKAKLDPKADRYIELSNSQLARLMGECEAGVTGAGRPRMPRSTAAYQRELLIVRKRWTLVDRRSLQPCRKRARGDGRERSLYRLHSYDTTLNLLVEDMNTATPKGRAFYVIDGRPLGTDEAVAWGLDDSLAQKMPEVWAVNARSVNPEEPMKPIPGAKPPLRAATAAEAAAVLKELTAKPWEIGATPEQAAAALNAAREMVAEISAEELAAAMRQALEKDAAIQHKKNPYRVGPWNFGFFSANRFERVRGIAQLWKSRGLEEALRATRDARIGADPQAADHQARTGPGPPQEFAKLRKPFPG